MDIEKNVKEFMEDRGPRKRYASFDYCFNYFRDFYQSEKIKEISSDENIDLSCLNLGFYLASWGMYRGSSELLDKSSKIYEDLIKNISSMDRKYWEIDIDDYSDEEIRKDLIRCKEKIENSLNEVDPTDTLVTKIMLAVFGNIPALDANFREGTGFYNSINEKLKKGSIPKK